MNEFFTAQNKTQIKILTHPTKCYIESTHKPIIEYLLNHEDFDLDYANKTKNTNEIIGVGGELPLSCIRLKDHGTESMDYLSRVVSNDKDMKKKEAVYILQKANSSIFKIGRSYIVNNRLKMINAKLPFKTKIFKLFFTKESKKIEKILHQKYKNKKVRGEWFELTNEDLKWLSKVESNEILDNEIKNKTA